MGRPTLRTSQFADWLRSQRSNHSLEEIARKARKAVGGVIAFDRSSWNKLEAGQLPNVIQVWGIAKALDVPVLDLIRRILQDLEVPVGEAAPLRKAPPLSSEAQAIARRYDNADSKRRDSVRFVLDGVNEGSNLGRGRKRRRVASAEG